MPTRIKLLHHAKSCSATNQVVRGIIIVLMSPLLRRTGYGLSWREGIILWWSGLRGAVGLALSLYLLLDDLILDLRYRTVSFLFMGLMAVRAPRISPSIEATTDGCLLACGGIWFVCTCMCCLPSCQRDVFTCERLTCGREPAGQDKTDRPTDTATPHGAKCGRRASR